MRVSRGLLLKIGMTVLLVALLVAVVAWWPEKQSDRSAEGEWTCSMHAQIRLPRPGRCPICGMDLIPVAQLTREQAQIERRVGLETETIAYRQLFKEIRTVGRLDYNERRVAYITARIAGRLDRLYADFTGIQVKKEDHLADIYSPDLVVTVDNLLNALYTGNSSLAESARERLRLWGMLPSQIKEIEQSGKVRTHLTVYAPIGGTVIEKAVREGQYVKEGDLLYRIAELDPLWLLLDAYEYDIAWIRFGQQVEVTVEAFPGQKFRGTVTFIDPYLDDKTRTVKVRVNLPNPQRKLKPAMYASVSIRVGLLSDGTPEPTGLEGKYICPMHPEIVRDEAGRCSICGMNLERVPDVTPHALPKRPRALDPEHVHEERVSQPNKILAVRASAVLDTGRRKIAYRKTADDNLELAELQLGPRAEGLDDKGKKTSYYPVLDGLQPGDRVVVRGAALLDSQRQIEGMPSLLYPQGQSAASLHGEHAAPTTQPKVAPGGAPHKH